MDTQSTGDGSSARAARSATSNADVDKDDDSEWVDYDEIEEMLSRVVPRDTCLFCNKQSPNIKNNVTHMNLMHGFFIPEEQYLIDLKGMLEYLGFKVGAGLTCLWCNKQFTSLHGVRLHMLYKDHCKIFFDQQKATDEFKEFYDYSTQEVIPMKPIKDLAIPRRRSERYNEHRALVSAKTYKSKQLIVAQKNPSIVAGTYQSKSINKFNAQRAKTILRIGMGNNNAMRGRIRQQNPI